MTDKRVEFVSVMCYSLITMDNVKAAIIVAADAEWDVVLQHYRRRRESMRPYETFMQTLSSNSIDLPVIFIHSGCGKVPAAAAAQYAIDTWRPDIVVNIGTCGAIAPDIGVGDHIVAGRTVIYDICERSGGQAEMIERFTTVLPHIEPVEPLAVRRGTLVTGDRDADPDQIAYLVRQYDALAADWESGAVAYVAVQRNHTDCLILRVVSDLVHSGEIGDVEGLFERRVSELLPELLETLTHWLTSKKEG